VHWAGAKGPHAANARSDAAGGGHAHAGVMSYLGASWPEEYRGKLFIGNIHGQRLNMDIPERSGSGYVGHHGKDFLNFNDTWSQTLNQLYDQDGSVYTIDWYDKNQCHNPREDGHDRSNGRIYKIVYDNRKTTKVDLQKLGDGELVKLALSKNEWMSRHARRILQERDELFQKDVAKLSDGRPVNRDRVSQIARHTQLARDLAMALEQGKATPEMLRALWTLRAMGGLTPQTVMVAMKSRDIYVRAWAIQLALEESGAQPAVVDQLRRLGREDKSPVVRLYLASALQRMPPSQRWELLEQLVGHAEDADDHNLPLMYWYAAEACVASDPAKAVALLKKCRIPVVREFIARRLATMSLSSAK